MNYTAQRVVSDRGIAKTSRPSSPMTLPPMLSPTLPPWAEDMLPQKMLSPTLPSLFDGSEIEDSLSLNSLKKDKSNTSSSVAQPLPSRTKKSRVLDTKSTETSKFNTSTGSTSSKSKAKSYSNSSSIGSGPASLPLKPGTVKKSLIVKLQLNKTKLEKLTSASEQKVKINSPVGLGINNNNDSTSPIRQSRGIFRQLDDKRGEAAESKQKKIKVTRSYSSSSESEDEPLSKRILGGDGGLISKSSNIMTNGTSKADLNKNLLVSPTNSLYKDKISTEQREKYYRLLRSKMRNWIDLARQRKHDSDNATKLGKDLTAVTISMDSLFAFIVGFDYEDRAELMIKKDPHFNSWATLVPYTTRLIRIFENHNIKELKGLTYCIRALIHMRIGSVAHGSLQKVLRSIKEVTNLEELKKLYKELESSSSKYVASQESAISDFRRGCFDLTIDSIEKKFPKTWKGRDTAYNSIRKHDGGYRPTEDPYCVPLQVFSSLQDGCALGYAIVKEWAVDNNIDSKWAIEPER